MGQAIFARSVEIVDKLCSIAHGKAKALECKTRRIRRDEWKAHVCDDHGDCSKVGKALSRHAYRWIRGPAGWPQSPLCTFDQHEASLIDDLPIDLGGYLPNSISGPSGDLQDPNLAEGQVLVPLNDQAAAELASGRRFGQSAAHMLLALALKWARHLLPFSWLTF